MRKFPKRNIIIPKKELISIPRILFEPSSKKSQYVTDFEIKFKEYLNANDSIAVSSGRTALNLIIDSYSIEKGSEILLCAYNFIGVPESLLKKGFIPVFVEADKNTYQIDINDIERKISNKTKAIIITHLFGHLTDIDAIKPIAQKHNILIIEDAAQALGSSHKDRFAGTISDIGFFSFTGSKPLNTSFGGMIITRSLGQSKIIRQQLSMLPETSTAEALSSRLRTYLYALATNKHFYSYVLYPLTILFDKFNIDILEKYKIIDRSITKLPNNRLNYIQAFIGLNQMDHISSLLEQRRGFGNKLISMLDISISTQSILENSEPCYFMLPLKSKDKTIAYKKLLAFGIDANLSYAQDCSFLTNSNNPMSKFLSDHILTINLPFDLKEEEVAYIADSINGIKEFLE